MLRYRSIGAPLHMRGVVWSERSYARYGLGFADPWSDRRLAEFAMTVPQQVLTRPGRTEKRVRHRVQHDVAIRVTEEAEGVVERDSSEEQSSARDEAVHVEADSHGHIRAAIIPRDFARRKLLRGRRVKG
jgi:asparagine synthase (glutamine-hydrolysing)